MSQAVLLFALAVSVRTLGADPRAAGVVVESVRATGTAARAGVRPGDVLLTWRSSALPAAGGQGRLASTFDLAEVHVAHGQCGVITLAGRRNGHTFAATVEAGDWNVEVRPVLSAADDVAYEEARTLLSRGDLDGGVARLRDLAGAIRAREGGAAGSSLLLRAARALADAERWESARQAFADARSYAASEIQRAALFEAEARALMNRQPSDAREALGQAIEIRRRIPTTPLALAADLAALAAMTRDTGDLGQMEALAREALAVAEATSPGSLIAAHSLDTLVMVVIFRSFAEGCALTERGFAIRSRLAPESVGMVRSLTLLGGNAFRSGDLAQTEVLWARALQMQHRLDPGGPAEAVIMGNVGILARERGDNRRAEALVREALAIKERTSPGGLVVANLLLDLCSLGMDRGDWSAAEGLCRRALTVAEVNGVENLSAGWALGTLGDIARQSGRPHESEALHARAIAILERVAPGSLELGDIKATQARLSLELGDHARAKDFATKALLDAERQGHDGPRVAEMLQVLGDIALHVHERAEAEELYGRALSIRERLAPGTRWEAETLHALARVRRETGRREAALEAAARAVAALDQQRGRAGGSYEARSRFAAIAVATYYDYLDLLVESGDPEGAFHALERSRARAFLDVLTERDLDLSGEVTADQEAERRRLDAAYDQALKSLSDPGTAAEAKALDAALQRLAEARDRRNAFGQRLTQESPRYASTRYPVPLGLGAAREALDPGTVLLAYAVEETRTLLFVVEPAAQPEGGLSVLPIPVGAARLREAVESFRRGVERGPAGGATAWRREAAELYTLLVAPAESRLAGAKRVAISPDGPLHLLPFAALLRQGAPLIAWKPLHVTPSATVSAELLKRRARKIGWDSDLLAFGDPVYGSHPARPAAAPDLRDSGLRPLPATRREVQAIAALFPGRAQVLVGDAATEERAKAVGKNVRYVHFACHGLLDRRFPLDSALALSRPADVSAGENGLFQAWEILERVRLDADMVTLSACESGLGAEVGGEGLLGLTRAFLHAGARSVVASLWGVSDRSTAQLMERFYRHLARGAPKDEALRAAQLEMLRGGGPRSHPYYWAAFHLMGDWK